MDQQQPQWDFNGLLSYLDKLHKSEITTAKRDLAVKVLAAIKAETSGVNDLPWRRGVEAASAAVEQLFLAEGIEVERSSDGDHDNTPG